MSIDLLKIFKKSWMVSNIEQHVYPNKTNWAKLVKILLESLGCGNAWLYQGVGNNYVSLTASRLDNK